MRIATSTIYAQQAAAIDDQQALYAQIGQQLNSGKQLNDPSDDPARIAQDLYCTPRSTGGQQSKDVQNAVSELTTTDSALSSLTVGAAERASARDSRLDRHADHPAAHRAWAQIDELLQQAIAVGNTSFAGRYVFAGTANTANPPVQQQGNRRRRSAFLGNNQAQGQLVYNGQEFALSTTFGAAFNYQSANGSPDVFATLVDLRDTLQKQTAVDQSASAINRAGAVVYGPQGFRLRRRRRRSERRTPSP